MSSIFIDPSDLPGGVGGFIQLLTLLAFYGYILFVSSGMISDGSELLLLVPSIAGLVGSCVLPVLGAVPDGAIVLFSGMGPDAQEQLSVGVGALAGSTVMLLTVPAFLSVLAGRVNMENGMPVYKKPAGAGKDWAKLSPPGNMSLLGTGVAVGDGTRMGARLMLATALLYLIIQGPAFVYTGEDDEVVSKGENDWALAGFILAFLAFLGYLYLQWWQNLNGDGIKEQRREEVIKAKIMNGEVSLLGVCVGLVKQGRSTAPQEGSPLLDSSFKSKMEVILAPFFAKYDVDKSGSIDLQELSGVLRDMGEKLKVEEIERLFRKFDTDGNNSIDFEEFVQGMLEYVTSREAELAKGATTAAEVEVSKTQEDDDEGEEEEEEEIPEDLTDLPPAEQQKRIIMRSLWLMGIGTLFVLIFSDPMVDVLSELGDRINVSPFYVSFVLAPVASNASELIASYNYALKKTSASMDISLSALAGAACMNNTFVLFIFLLLIYVQELEWTFSAETIAILLSELGVGLLIMGKKLTLLGGLVILCIYPLSLIIVGTLEAVGLD